MGLRYFESQILKEARQVTGNRKLRQKDIMEWATTEIKARDFENTAYLPESNVYIAYKGFKIVSKGFLISKFLPKGYKGTYNTIQKGKMRGYYRLFDYETK